MSEPTDDSNNQAPQQAVPDTVEINDVNQFATAVIHWHKGRMGQLHHLLKVPEGTTFEVGEGAEATKIELSGDVLAGFKFGVEMAIMQFNELPFVAEMEPPSGDAPKLN